MDNIFLFSLPRSGSTLVQRVLSKHDEISTVSEPWVLLPLLSMAKAGSCYSEYDCNVASDAICDLINKLPEKKKTYNSAIKSMVNQLYLGLSETPTRYFLDKTPRYHCVVGEIYETFPDAKFIFLWRNPLSIAASSISTWGKKGAGKGVWNVYNIKIDLYKGLLSLIDAYKSNASVSMAVKYEDLVSGAYDDWEGLFRYLDIDMNDTHLRDIGRTEVDGRMGDKTGTKEYDQISSNSVTKWKDVLNNPLRKYWAKRYLRWLGSDNLRLMGYDMDHLLKEVSDAPFTCKYCMSDIFRMIYGLLFHAFDIAVLRAKCLNLYNKKKIYGNS